LSGAEGVNDAVPSFGQSWTGQTLKALYLKLDNDKRLGTPIAKQRAAFTFKALSMECALSGQGRKTNHERT